MILYRLLMALALPFLLLATLPGRWPKGTWRERLAITPVAQADWWVHGASLGELTSARVVIAALAQEGTVHVTTNTATGRALVQGWAIPQVRVSFSPFDTAGAPARLIRQLQPRAFITVENELWPSRLAAARAAHVPSMIIGARLSARSAKRWQVAGSLIRRLLGDVRFLSAQDATSEARFLTLGLPRTALGPRFNLKAGIAVAAVGESPLPRARTLLAASTHAGEEALILDAFTANRAAFDHLIIAPRHPERGDEAARLLAARSLPFARRSHGVMPQPDQPVFLADTTGEMDIWYPMAAVTIIGGSFADRGGHTPFEPAAYGSALIHGPSIHNFAEVFAALAATDACIAVPDAGGLTAALATLSPVQTQRLAQNATKALAGGADISGLITAIITHAQPKG